MDFEIWKVNHGIADGPARYTYSFRPKGEDKVIILLDQGQLSKLFPGIDPETVPVTPGTGLARIEAGLIDPIKED